MRRSVDLQHLAAYNRVCGFRLRDELPPTYPHVLAFPLAVKLLTRSLRFAVLGLVHVENRIEVVRPIGLGERLDLQVRAAEPEPHPRGTQVVVHGTAEVEGEEVWREQSTYLRRSGSGGSRSSDAPGSFDAVWDVPGDIGRRYARVSGDWNPIHLHPLTARAFGQRGPIAHGMWTAARCLSALEGVAVNEFDVQFRRPVAVPGRVGFTCDANAFSVWDPQTRACLVTGKTQ